MRIRRISVALFSGLALAIASSAYAGQAQALYAEIMGCEQGCAVAAAGWPLPYLIDYPGISVVGSASLIGMLTGEDQFRLPSFLGTTIFWALVALAAGALWKRGRR
ncbi:hypothetical protein [Sphingobium tyrosinilyticum]|uniref:Uncharacterized protein n=1 Tax=Sphingobium tyrosinilyticum TaxID=2715436 RepID=A0ABV9EZJ1_9SPHN